MSNLVTGGSGFCGSYIVNKLLANGESVCVLDAEQPEIEHKNLTFLKGNILDPYALKHAMKNIKTLYHAAALVPISKAGKKFIKVNVGGTRQIMEEASRAAVEKVIYISSSAVLGTPQVPISDDADFNPIGKYAFSKMMAEKVCNKFIKNNYLDITFIRPRTVVGPGRLGVFQILFEWIYEGRYVFIIGKGNNFIQFIHGEDLANLCIAAAKRRGTEVFNVGAFKFKKIREELEALCNYAGTGSSVISLPVIPAVTTLRVMDKLNLSPLADWHYLTYHKDVYFDNKNAINILKWRPKYSNLESLIQSYNWYVSNRKVLIEKGYRYFNKSPVNQLFLGLIKKFF